MLRPEWAQWVVAVLVAGACCYHVALLTGHAPWSEVWGGRLERADRATRVRFEAVSLCVLAAVAAAALPPLRLRSTGRAVVLRCFTALFLLNTAGNLVARHTAERVLGTVATLTTAVCLWLIADAVTPAAEERSTGASTIA